MILIIESGSTKTDWCITEKGHIIHHSVTNGLNPLLHSEEIIHDIIGTQLPASFFENRYEHIFYYGAGCISDSKKQIIHDILFSAFTSLVSVENDLLAAARSLFHKQSGIACILGTGSNSCLYNGKEITQNVKPLGYILGDEGSGATLGKVFIADYLKDLAPKTLTSQFFDYCKLSYEELMDKIYKESFPNRFLASISQFLFRHIEEEYIYNLIYKNFELFFIRCIAQYDYKNYPVAFTGSVAYHFSDILNDVAKDFGIEIKKIVKSPIEGLIDYHK